MRCYLQISSYRIDLMSVNGPISPKQCYYEMDYSFYSFYWLDSLEIRLDHNSTYYRSLSKNSDVKPRISHCDSQNLQYKTHPEFWPSHRRIFKTSLYYETRLILETRRYIYIYRYWYWYWLRSGARYFSKNKLYQQMNEYIMLHCFTCMMLFTIVCELLSTENFCRMH